MLVKSYWIDFQNIVTLTDNQISSGVEKTHSIVPYAFAGFIFGHIKLLPFNGRHQFSHTSNKVEFMVSHKRIFVLIFCKNQNDLRN